MKSSIIEKMGYEVDDIVVITHIDDIASSHSANVASFECLDFGVAKCGSIISVSSWLMEVTKIYKQNKDYDLGVHLTLTSEYDTYRWRPLNTSNQDSGLFDSEGYLWRTSQEAIANAKSNAVELEMRAQIDTVINNGIDITHIDTHMGTVISPKFIRSYLNLSKEYRIPAFFPRVPKKQLEKFISMNDIESEKYPFIDHLRFGSLEYEEDKIKFYCDMFNSLKPGLTHLLFHPAKLSPELKAIGHTPDERNQDYEAFTSQRLKDYVESLDIHLIGYRDIRKFIRESL